MAPQRLGDVTAIATAGVPGLAMRADGLVLGWGQYFAGSGTTPAFVPAGLSNVVAIAAAESHGVAVVCLRPTLEAVQTASNRVLLQWDLAPEDWVLQQSVGLGPGEWTEVEALPNDRGGRRFISLRVLDGARFFRLRLR